MAAEPSNSAPAAKPRSRIVVIGAVLLIALLAAGGTWYFMHADSGPSAPKAVHSATPAFMTLETFTVNLNGGNGEQYLQTDISLQLSAASNEPALKQVMPLIKAKIVMILSSKGPDEISSSEGKSKLSQEITEAVNALLPGIAAGKPVRGVFFTSFIIQ